MLTWCTSYLSLIPRRMDTVSCTDGSPTCIGWNLRARAASFSISLYSFKVVAPQHWTSPRASAGLRRLLASTLPSALPSPSRTCSSSTNKITSWASSTSFKIFFKRSSKSPLNLAPAMSWPRSRATTRLFLMLSGTSPLTIRCARPSNIAVLPTPAAPISTGLFFVLRESICIVR